MGPFIWLLFKCRLLLVSEKLHPLFKLRACLYPNAPVGSFLESPLGIFPGPGIMQEYIGDNSSHQRKIKVTNAFVHPQKAQFITGVGAKVPDNSSLRQ